MAEKESHEMTPAEAKREGVIAMLLKEKIGKDGAKEPPRARSRAHAEFLIKTESVLI